MANMGMAYGLYSYGWCLCSQAYVYTHVYTHVPQRRCHLRRSHYEILAIVTSLLLRHTWYYDLLGRHTCYYKILVITTYLVLRHTCYYDILGITTYLVDILVITTYLLLRHTCYYDILAIASPSRARNRPASATTEKAVSGRAAPPAITTEAITL